MNQFLKNSDPRFHLVELRSKSFILILLAILLSIIGFAAYKQEWFRPVKYYWMMAETSEGLQQGMSVRLSGFRIGSVTNIELKANRRVKVDLAVFEEYSDYIHKETIAKLRGENLIGDRFIELGMDSDVDGSPILPEGSEITYQRGKTMDEMVESIEKKLNPILTGLGTLAKSLPNTVSKLDATIDETNGLITDFRSENGNWNAGLVAFKDGLDEFGALASSLRDKDSGLMHGVASFNEASATLNQKIGPLIDSLQKGTETLTETTIEARELFSTANDMVKNIDEVVQKSSEDVPNMVKKGAAAADKADDVIDSVRRMWPIRGGVSDGGEDLLRTGSDD